MKNILNLYSNQLSARDAYIKAFMSETRKYKIQPREYRINVDDSILYFKWFINYDYSKSNDLSGQYSEINFYVDLPEQVKNHFLSRIRLPNN